MSGFSYIHASGVANNIYNERIGMSEIIRISNFGGIREMEMELKPINVIIGPQASGKSVTAKLLYYFKSFFTEIYKGILEGESKRELDDRQIDRFNAYFPPGSWSKTSFQAVYHLGNSFINIETNKRSKVALDYSDNIKQVIEKSIAYYKKSQKMAQALIADAFWDAQRIESILYNFMYERLQNEVAELSHNTQRFIPAGRSFFANVQSGIFSFLSNNRSIDPFVIEFGSFYENFKRYAALDSEDASSHIHAFNSLIAEVINGNYLREKEKDFLVHRDSRKVNLSYASSGQQEALPLVIVLKALLYFHSRETTLYIEEPEAHLFPVAQKRIVQLLARTFNQLNGNFQIIATTHSPYILAAFNNLMEAGKILDEKEGMEEELTGIIPKEEIISPGAVAAYSLVNGVKTDLIDPSTKLISQNILDSVSDEISIEFGKLLDLEF